MQLSSSKNVLKTVLHVIKHIKRNDISENCSTFASTVHTTLPIRTASQGVSFVSIYNVIVLPLHNAQLTIISKIIVPAVHTVRSASGSFFLYTYAK